MNSSSIIAVVLLWAATAARMVLNSFINATCAYNRGMDLPARSAPSLDSRRPTLESKQTRAHGRAASRRSIRRAAVKEAKAVSSSRRESRAAGAASRGTAMGTLREMWTSRGTTRLEQKL